MKTGKTRDRRILLPKLRIILITLVCIITLIKYLGLSTNVVGIDVESLLYLNNINICDHINVSYHPESEASCAKRGFTSGVYCGDCGCWISGHKELPMTEHKYCKTVIQPTCLFGGYSLYVCEFCGDYYMNEATDILGHDMSVTDELVAATCTEEGVVKVQCSRCDYFETYDKAPAGHAQSDWIIDSAPDCVNIGSKHVECTVCAEVLDKQQISAVGHKYNITHKSPTCTKDGSDVYICSECKSTKTVITEPKTGHSLSDWYTIRAAGCVEDGVRERKCKNCDYVKKETITAKGHIESKWITDKKASCVQNGHRYVECTDCKITLKSETIKAKGHTESKWITDKKADCVKSGHRYIECTVCKDTLKSETIAAKGHNSVADKAVAATCTKDGKTAGSHCSVCKKVIKAQKVIKAVGHKTKQNNTAAKIGKDGKTATVCTVCNKTIKSAVIAQISTVKLSSTSYVCDNNAKTPEVTVKDSKGKKLERSKDYTVKYAEGRKTAGIYSVKVTFKGNYSGTKTLTFKIFPAKTKKLTATQTTSSVKLTWSKASGATGYRVYKYDAKNKKYVKIADTSKTSYTINKLKVGTSYKYAVKSYAKSGGTVLWSSSYAEISTATMPATPKLKVSSGSKKANLSWNKESGVTGYEIYMASSENGRYKKIGTVKKSSTIKFTKSGLNKGKVYYFKIRAYKTVGNTNIYSAYSAVKHVKIK